MRKTLAFAAAFAVAVIFFTQNITVLAKVFDKNEVPLGWEEKRSAHFIIYYNPNIPKRYVDMVVRKSEDSYKKITDRLGFRRFNFWLWEDRAKIFIYDTIEEYQKHRGEPEWSGAAVNVRQKKIYTFFLEEKFFERFLPHEIGHIIFREFIGMNNRAVPLWLDEGVACAQEEAGRLEYVATAKGLVESGMYLKIPDLMKIGKGNLAMPTMFYAESASIIIFLEEKFRSRKFSNFCRELRDEKTVDEALEKAYRIKGVRDLNDQWEDHIKNITYQEIHDKYGSAGTR